MFLRNIFRGPLMDQAGGAAGGAPAGGGAPATGGAAPAAGGGAPAAGGGGGAPPAFDWGAHGFAPNTPDLGYIQNKQWAGPADVVKSYRELEGFYGVPAERLMKLPEADGDWNPIYDRLGRPKTAAEYKIPVPQGDKGEFAKIAGEWFHGAGLSQKQVEAVAGKWNEFVGKQLGEQAKAAKTRTDNQVSALKEKWGADNDANWTIAENAAKKFGMSDEDLAAIRDAMGGGRAVEFLYNIGRSLGVEGGFVDGEGQQRTGFGMTREQAMSEIVRLKDDKEFISRLKNGDGPTRQRFELLHRVAYAP